MNLITIIIVVIILCSVFQLMNGCNEGFELQERKCQIYNKSQQNQVICNSDNKFYIDNNGRCSPRYKKINYCQPSN